MKESDLSLEVFEQAKEKTKDMKLHIEPQYLILPIGLVEELGGIKEAERIVTGAWGDDELFIKYVEACVRYQKSKGEKDENKDS